MVKGSVVTAVVAITAMGAVLTAFMTTSSQYVTMDEARKLHDDRLHLAGDLIKDSVHTDFVHHKLLFRLRDSDGTVVQVVHVGEVPANMQEATKVVAIGGVQGDNFVSTQLLVKCPSKYEEKTSVSGA